MRHQLATFFARAREVFRPRARAAAERDEEFAFHLEMETAENIRNGMSEGEARRAALLRFGGTQRFREETSDARGIVVLDNLARDARFALRRLRRAPAFAAGVIATLGIGIGVAAGIGTVVHGVLLRDLPYHEPDRLMHVGFTTRGMEMQGDRHSGATYFHLAKGARSFTDLGAYWTRDDFNVTDGDAPERVTVAMMTPNTFTLLGVRPLLGQLFVPGDTSWSDPRLAILISEDLWRRRYGGDSSIIGRRIDINRGERNVVGVLPRSFDFPTPSVDIYYPAPVAVGSPQIVARGFNVVGRLREGANPAAAEAELNALVPSLTERFPAITSGMLRESQARVVVTPLKVAMVASVRPQLVLLGVLVAVVLLIATTNVVSLFLLRTERASQEIAIALSLGATRLSLAQRFVVEGITLGLASTIVALPATALVVSTKFGFTELEIPRLHEVSFTWQTMALVIGSAALIGGVVGLLALTRSSMAGLADRLRAPRSTASRTWRRAQDGLVAFQVAIALVLLVAAGLLGRSFLNLSNAEFGFEPRHAMTFQASLPWSGYRSYTDAAILHARLSDRLAALPGVTSVAVARSVPLADAAPSLDLELQAGDQAGRPKVAATGNMASAEYFGVMGIPLLSGRSFRSGDLHGSPAVVVSRRLAESVFGTAEVVGRTITRTRAGTPPQSYRVVGVVGDVHSARIEDGHTPTLYYPIQRDGDGLPPDSSAVPGRPMDVQYVIRGTELPSPQTIHGIVMEVDRRIPPTAMRPLEALVDDATARVRLTMLLIAVAGLAALLLSVIGVYSVVAYAANGRVREFGIRLALGAAPAHVGGMVLGDGLRVIAIGTVAGLAVAYAATRLLRALLYQVEPTSVSAFGIATALLVAVTLLATLLPARRAARTPPAVVLRGE